MKLIAADKDRGLGVRDTAALFLPEEFHKGSGAPVPPAFSFIKDRINLRYFKAKPGETLFIPFGDKPAVIVVGLGKKGEITAESLRTSAGAAVDVCRRKRISTLHVFVPEIEKLPEPSAVGPLAEGLCLANYAFDRYKSKGEDTVKTVDTAVFHVKAPSGTRRLLAETGILCENTLLCRNLVNETSDLANPVAIAREAKRVGRLRGVSCRVLARRDLERLKMGLILAVGRGSAFPPQLVLLNYRGDPKNRKSVAIVGKGITFDSGGLNLKPTGHIEGMRGDMAGAATCIYTIKAAAELRLKANIAAVVPLCENMLSNTSFRPGDVYKAHNGKSVEIGNTDAEGRLVLADALAYAEEKFKPGCIIDIATLTGACLVCFGEIVAGLISNNDPVADELFAAGEETGERLWRLPLYREYGEELKSDIADIRNVSASRNAGTIMGAVFLKNFVKKTPWAHIDIAGTSWFSKQRGYRPKNATGFGVRLLIEAIRRLRRLQGPPRPAKKGKERT